MLTFSRDFFQEEIRWDYKVDRLTKRSWAALLELVTRIDRICRKHRIQYFADWGTLLGAVRHKGFIPWDDDLDLTMKREDYNKFLKIAPNEFEDFEEHPRMRHLKQEFPLTYHSPYTSEHSYMYQVFITNDRTIRNDAGFLRQYHGYPFVAAIDIFPLDYFPEDNEETELVSKIVTILSGFVLMDDHWKDEGVPAEEEVIFQLKRVEEMLGYHFDWSKNLRIQALRLMDKVYSMYSREESKYLENAFWVANNSIHTQRYLKEWYDDVVYLPFENIELPVPAEYDKVLTAMYGDYMTPCNYGGHGEEQMKILLEHYNFGDRDPREALADLVEAYE